MLSITYWNRLEPRPKSYSIEEGLAAKIRDPLWMLSRQWQFGEFQGEDSGSPAHAEISAKISKIFGPLNNGSAPAENEIEKSPLEVLIEDEPFAPDFSIKVELGQTFESLLNQKLAKAKFAQNRINKIVEAFRNEYFIDIKNESKLSQMKDQEKARFLRVCASRAVDGSALFEIAILSLPSLPPKPSLDPKYHIAVKAALEEFVLWVKDVFRDIDIKDPSDWAPQRLEYNSKVAASNSDESPLSLSSDPDSSGDLDWYAFDMEKAPPGWLPPPESVSTIKANVVPANVKFRGMPNPRWWDFERGTTDFGDIRPDKLDIARLVVMEFMLVHGIDWFILPLEQKVGTICRADALLVKDVFGDFTQIERADKQSVAGNGGWTMFSTAIQGNKNKVADLFILSPSVSVSKQLGPVIEDIRFLRDETANMAWGVEHTTEDGIGQPWSGYERSIAATSSVPQKVETSEEGIPLRYLIQTVVPENWIPLIPISIDPDEGKFMLQRSVLLDGSGNESFFEPMGRILQPTNLPTGDVLYRIFEEEVPRAGARVYREICRSRWIDGSTHIWINRKKAAGTGEGSSGLKFDLAIRHE